MSSCSSLLRYNGRIVHVTSHNAVISDFCRTHISCCSINKIIVIINRNAEVNYNWPISVTGPSHSNCRRGLASRRSHGCRLNVVRKYWAHNVNKLRVNKQRICKLLNCFLCPDNTYIPYYANILQFPSAFCSAKLVRTRKPTRSKGSRMIPPPGLQI